MHYALNDLKTQIETWMNFFFLTGYQMYVMVTWLQLVVSLHQFQQ